MFKKSIGFFFLLSFFLIGCTSTSNQTNKNNNLSKNKEIIRTVANKNMENKIEKQFKNWKGVSYKVGGKTKSGIDCSAFVMNFYDKNFNFILPRTTSEKLKLGEKIKNKNELKSGDLVFFKTGRGPTGHHVGIYYKDGLFLHVSSSNGVMYSSLNDSYWSRKYMFAKRVKKVIKST